MEAFMKKNTFVKILFIAISIFALVFSLILLIDNVTSCIESLKHLKQLEEYNELQKIYIRHYVIYPSFSFFLAILFFLVINVKGLRFVTESLIEKISKKKKENRKAKLEREIAQKQAELNELTNEPKIE